MEKYYTPTLEEFHVGFEYEYQDGPDDSFEPRVHTVFNETERHIWVNDFRDFKGTYVMAPIMYRVKYLDREDIEDVLGKEFKEDSVKYSSVDYKYKKGDIYSKAWIVSYWVKDRELQITRYDFKGENNPDSSRCVFEGTVKNKSEFKRILKQLGLWK
jgi:hypothetical protein